MKGEKCEKCNKNGIKKMVDEKGVSSPQRCSVMLLHFSLKQLMDKFVPYSREICGVSIT